MFSELIKDLQAHRTIYIDSNPIFARLVRGDLTRFHYLAYLRETYHLVKHTPKYLTVAANRVVKHDERLANYFRKFSQEETGHELLCIRDIDALGENVDIITSGDSNPGAWGIVTQCYFWAIQGNPVALLGDAFATEEIGVSSGTEAARLLESNYGIPRNATNFLRVHGSEDKEHLEAAAHAIEWYAGNRDHSSDINFATRMTYRSYGQLFTDVLELGDNWSKERAAGSRSTTSY
jgi:pyrroloquinoline quinone (PQQ) biosynthesis protein C